HRIDRRSGRGRAAAGAEHADARRVLGRGDPSTHRHHRSRDRRGDQKILVLHAAHHSSQTQRIVSFDINAVGTRTTAHERARTTMDSNPGGVPPLQFDTAVPSVAPSGVITAQGVRCTVCQRAIADEYFDVNGQSVCDGCRTQLAQLAQTPRSWGLFVKAGLFGLVAAILGAILYYAVIAITDFEIGIVAIAIGYMVRSGLRNAH